MNYLTLSRQIGSYETAELIRVFDTKDPSWYLLNRDTELPDSVLNAARRLADGEPLQYITGVCEFYGDSYAVSPDCLIPQPDTEHTVTLALAHLKAGNRPVLLDLCTGSGCIAVSSLKRAPHASGIAADLSDAALAVAAKNAASHGVADRLQLIAADVLIDPRVPGWIRDADVITSNPPYINSDVILTLPVPVQREPHMALDGGADGMDFYRRFILDYAPLMKPSAVMILEIGYDQSERIAALCRKAGLDCRFHRDYGNILRVAEIQAANPQ